MGLLDSVAEAAGQAIAHLASRTESRQDSGSSTSGPPQINKSITPCTTLAQHVKDVATLCTDATASQYANPLAANPAEDWEQYQGCRLPMTRRTAPGSIVMLEPWDGTDKQCWDIDNMQWKPCPKSVEVHKPALSVTGPLERQVGGDHYKKAALQPIEFIQANNLSFCEGSAVKYIARHRLKGGRQDLEKAIHYLEMEIAHSYGK